MKILIAQTSFLGDTILSTPVIYEIKKLYPESKLWIMTTPLSSALVKRDPLISGVIAYDKRKKHSGIKGFFTILNLIKSMNFDKVYSLHRSYRTSILLWLSRISDRIGFKDAKLSFLYNNRLKRKKKDHDVLRNLSILSDDLNIYKKEAELRLFAPKKSEIREEFINILNKLDKYAVVMPSSVWKTKMWHSQGFRDVSFFLKNSDINVVLLGSKEDIKVNAKVAYHADFIDLTGKTTISETMYIISKASIVVCNDSMGLHMASAFKIPNVAIFCATSPDFGFSPWKNKAIIVQEDLKCRPCARHGSQKCPNGTDACMKFSADKVIDAVKMLTL
jgi:heptosyltransferase II